MSFEFSWDWVSAPAVRVPELAATWSQLRIDLGEKVATLVEERGSGRALRRTLDVPTYPLAEFIALHWWELQADSHVPEYRGLPLRSAGDGFAWPELTLRPDRGTFWIDLRARDQDPDFVRFLSEGSLVLDAEQCRVELARFVDATVRQLESSRIIDTPLQLEWTSIQSADQEESDFNLVAAAWGFDPYDIADDKADSLIRAFAQVQDVALLSDLARVVGLQELSLAFDWVQEAAQTESIDLDSARVEMPRVELSEIDMPTHYAPWAVGFGAARRVRDTLELDVAQLPNTGELVSIAETSTQAPMNVDGLAKISESRTSVIVDRFASPTQRRFVSARAIARRAMSDASGTSLLTRGVQYSDRVERAFAAEFLAPAARVRDLLRGDLSEARQHEVAIELEVSVQVIEHQIENQIIA